jgi:CBS domain-containing protein
LNDKPLDVFARLRASGWSECIVINDERVVIGRVSRSAIDGVTSASLESLMEPGPSTYRPDVPVREIMAQLLDRNIESAPVTTPEGRLIGLFLREDGPHST